MCIEVFSIKLILSSINRFNVVGLKGVVSDEKYSYPPINSKTLEPKGKNETKGFFYAPLEKGGILFCDCLSVSRYVGL